MTESSDQIDIELLFEDDCDHVTNGCVPCSCCLTKKKTEIKDLIEKLQTQLETKVNPNPINLQDTKEGWELALKLAELYDWKDVSSRAKNILACIAIHEARS